MNHSGIRLILNSSLMGCQWLAVRRTARRLFPGVAIEEREEAESERLVLDVQIAFEGRVISVSEDVAYVERFEKLLATEVDLHSSTAGPEEWLPSQQQWQPGTGTEALLC